VDGILQLLVLTGGDGASRHRQLLADAAMDGGLFGDDLGGRLVHGLAPLSSSAGFALTRPPKRMALKRI
jgi:hypothetical protein